MAADQLVEKQADRKNIAFRRDCGASCLLGARVNKFTLKAA